jgi:transposase-like protein
MGVPSPRNYSQEEKAAAIALGLSIGGNNAADKLGMPRRSLHNWLEQEKRVPTLITAETRSAVVDRLWQTLVRATEAVEAGLADPRQRLGDRARALEVLVHSHELLRGGATENVAVAVAPAENVVDMLALSEEQRETLRDALRAEIAKHEALERLSPGLAEQMDAEYRELGEKWRRIAEGREPLALGPGPVVIDSDEAAPLTPTEKRQLTEWLKASGQL